MAKEFTMIFLVNLPFFWTPLTRFDTLVDAKIHGKHNEQKSTSYVSELKVMMDNVTMCTIFVTGSAYVSTSLMYNIQNGGN